MLRVVDGEVTEEDADGCRTYGVCLYGEQGRCVRMADVDTDRDRVSQFAERLIGETVDEEQLRYLAEDLLADGYDGCQIQRQRGVSQQGNRQGYS